MDAHLSPGICALLQSAGHDALHTRQLPAQNQTPDQAINDLSVREQRVVISMVELDRSEVRIVT